MRRRDSSFVLALCISLALHGAVAWALHEHERHRGPRRPPAVFVPRDNGPIFLPSPPELREPPRPVEPMDPPAPVALPEPAPPPKPQRYQGSDDEFGDPLGKGYALNASPGDEPLRAKEAPEDQAFISRDPVGPGLVGNLPSPSLLPQGQEGEGGEGGQGGGGGRARGDGAGRRDDSAATPGAAAAKLPTPPALAAPREESAVFGMRPTAGTPGGGSPLVVIVPRRQPMAIAPLPSGSSDSGPEKALVLVHPSPAAEGPAAALAAKPAHAAAVAAAPLPVPVPAPAAGPATPMAPGTTSGQDRPLPPGAPGLDPGRPGKPGADTPAADPAPMTDSESDAFAKIGSVTFRNGRVEARFGRKIKTVRPRLTLAGRYDLVSLHFPSLTLLVKTDQTGQVTDVKLTESSGSNEIDQPCLVAVYEWWIEPPKDKSGKPVAAELTLHISWHGD